MTDLFRFVALRAPARELPRDPIDLSTQSKFQIELSVIHQQIAPAVAPAGADSPPIVAAHRIVEQFISGTFGPGFISATASFPHEAAFDQFAAAAAAAKDVPELAAAVQTAFGKAPDALIAEPDFQGLYRDVRDTIVAAIILPTARSFALADLARVARLIALIVRTANGDPSLGQAGAIQQALTATLLLPTAIFPLRADLPQPVGVGDLLVVNQQLKRYEAGDIAKIENILRGEKREKVDEHNLTTDTTTITETSKTTETTTSLDVTERFELKTEAANVLKEDLSANAGVNVSAKYGAVEINANANVAYSLSKEESTKVATDHAKDVTSRAATKVTEFVRQQEIARTIEEFKDREAHAFDNTQGISNISGVYQWLNKVYEAQVFNYGKRLLFDLTVPEPAAFIRDAVAVHESSPSLIPPEPFVLVGHFEPAPVLVWGPIGPGDLGPDGLVKPGIDTRPITPADLSPDAGTTNYYGIFLGKYGVLGVNAPPEPITTVSKGITGNKDDHDHLAAIDDLTIPQGYQATSIAVQGAFTLYEQEDGDETMWVFVGKHQFQARGQGGLTPAMALLPVPADQSIDEQGTIPIAVETQQARDFAITVDVTCSRTGAALVQWQVDTFSALVNAHTNLVIAYEDKLKAQKIQDASAPSLGDNPAQNRLIERTELKKACTSLLAGTDLHDADLNDVAVTDPPPAFPRPNVPPMPNPNIAGGDQEAFIRFFEQVFEWEHMMYLFYPYYWARRDTWYTSAIADNPDPLFAEFLKAGAARVVVPVRPQLEGDLRYFLMTGQIWGGGAMPEITDSDYLPITEEIRARDNAPGTETPQGDPWEVSLPTTLIQLRHDDTLPEWRKFAVNGRDVWVPGRIVNGKWTPDYGHLDNSGNWTAN
jgi:hypothetical protein